MERFLTLLKSRCLCPLRLFLSRACIQPPSGTSNSGCCRLAAVPKSVTFLRVTVVEKRKFLFNEYLLCVLSLNSHKIPIR